MARKPKDINLEADEVVESSEESLELESDDNETALELDEEDEDDKPAKGKPRRKKKEPAGFAAQMLQNSSSISEKLSAKAKAAAEAEAKVETAAPTATEEESEGTDISEEAVPEKKARRPRSTTEEKNLSVAMVSAFEAMTKHWDTAKLATDALVVNLEKVKKDLEEIKQASAEPLQKLIDQTKEKQAVASRVMFALSLGAIIFSFVSLTLSQSVRGQLLAVQKPAEHQTFTTKSAPLSAPFEKTFAAKTAPAAVTPPQAHQSNVAEGVAILEMKGNRAVRKPRSTKK